MPLLANTSQCTGCGACQAICPVHALHLDWNNEGFLFPCVDSASCINCGKCTRTCPVLGNKDVNSCDSLTCLGAFAAQASDEVLLQKSSSGGIFGLLAGEILRNNGAVCGCSWQDDFKSVHHVVIDSPQQLPDILESKYLQSVVDADIYRDIAKRINNNQKVMFCGTPCQIEGLNAYLKSSGICETKIKELLYRVSLICHGTPSPKIWERYMKQLENEQRSKVIFSRFRDKRFSWINFSQVTQFENGHEHLSCVKKRDAFMNFFWGGKNVFLRRSCSDCVCKKNYSADMTIADFWNVSSIFPDLDTQNGISAVVIHTTRGKQYWSEIQKYLQFCKSVDVEAIEKNNRLWRQCLLLSEKREQFYKLCNKKKLSLESIYERLRRPPFSQRLKNKLKRICRRLLQRVLTVLR